jgi:dienelactone hydrolase
MDFTTETTTDGVRERRFTLDDVPGVLWTPAGATGPRPLLLLAHGGGQHKTFIGVTTRARRYVSIHGFAVAALDAPQHGDRPAEGRDERFAAIRQLVAAGEPLGPHMVRYNTELSARAVPEWRATIDALQDLPDVGAQSPIGFWGVSLGCAIGVALLAAEPRISAAVLGLAGHDSLAAAAAQVRVPVEFLLQWDDEVFPRESGLALFDAFASTDKTLHANPGDHRSVPAFEMDSAERFFARHLTGGAAR